MLCRMSLRNHNFGQREELLTDDNRWGEAAILELMLTVVVDGGNELNVLGQGSGLPGTLIKAKTIKLTIS